MRVGLFELALSPGMPRCERLIWIRVSDESATQQEVLSAFGRAIAPLPPTLQREAAALGLEPLFHPERFGDLLHFHLGQGAAQAVGLFLSDGRTFLMYALASATSHGSSQRPWRSTSRARFFGDGSLLVAPSQAAQPGEPLFDRELREISNWASDLLMRYLYLLRPEVLMVAEASRLWRAIRFGAEVLEVIQSTVGRIRLGGGPPIDPRSFEGSAMLGIDLVLSTLERRRTVAKTQDGVIRQVEASDGLFPFQAQKLPLGWKRDSRRVLFDEAALPVIQLVCALIAEGAPNEEVMQVLARIRLVSPGRNRWRVWLWDQEQVAFELQARGLAVAAAPPPDLTPSDEQWPAPSADCKALARLRVMVGFWHAMEYREVKVCPAGMEPPVSGERVEVFPAPDGSHQMLLRPRLPGDLSAIGDQVLRAHEAVVRYFEARTTRVGRRQRALPLLGQVLSWEDDSWRYRAKSQVSRTGDERWPLYDVRRSRVGDDRPFWSSDVVRQPLVALDAAGLHQFVADRLITALEEGVPAGVGFASPFGEAEASLPRVQAELRSRRAELQRLDAAAQRAFAAYVEHEDGPLKERAQRHAESANEQVERVRAEIERLDADLEHSGRVRDFHLAGAEADVTLLVRALAALSSSAGYVPREVAADLDEVLRLRLMPLGPLQTQVHAAVRLPLLAGGVITMFADLGTVSTVRRRGRAAQPWDTEPDLVRLRSSSRFESLAAPATSDGFRWWRRVVPPRDRVMIPAALACEAVMSGDMTLNEFQVRHARDLVTGSQRFPADVADILRRRTLQRGLALEAKHADFIVNCPAADVRRSVWAALTDGELPKGLDPAFAAHLARTYLGPQAVPAWPDTPYATRPSDGWRPWTFGQGTLLRTLQALAHKFGSAPFSWEDAHTCTDAAGLPRLTTQSSLFTDRYSSHPSLVRVRGDACTDQCTTTCRQHLRKLVLSPCPHHGCTGVLDVYASVPELPGRQLCSACRRMPIEGSPIAPVSYIQALLRA